MDTGVRQEEKGAKKEKERADEFSFFVFFSKCLSLGSALAFFFPRPINSYLHEVVCFFLLCFWILAGICFVCLFSFYLFLCFLFFLVLVSFSLFCVSLLGRLFFDFRNVSLSNRSAWISAGFYFCFCKGEKHYYKKATMQQ